MLKVVRIGLVICDMWDRHWCRTATKGIADLASAIDNFATRVRASGGRVIHAPSNCADAYRDHRARRAVSALPSATPPPDTTSGKAFPAALRPRCIDEPPCAERLFVWTRQHLSIAIEDMDLIVDDDRDEVWRVVFGAGLVRVLIAGVHTNACVLSRPFGVKQLVRWNVPCVVVSDLTEAMPTTYTPSTLDFIDRNWCPVVRTDDAGVD